MPTKRFENLDPGRRERIIITAREEFVRNGYSGASLNAIIRDAKISKGSLYYYFEDKADLYLTVLGHDMEDMWQKIGGISIGEYSDNFWRDIEDYTMKWIGLIKENPDFVRLFREIFHISSSHQMPEAVEEFLQAEKLKFTKILEHGQKLGALRTDIPLELLGNILFGLGEAVDIWIFEHFEELSHKELKWTAELYIDMMKKIAGNEASNK
ncbi:TetR/AcrR family transcriptional regulator [Candidatus Latescibacterota bacterium]